VQRCEPVRRSAVAVPQIKENATVSSEALPVHARALLEHQEFVRSLAKSLLKDEHAAQDVAQETLLTLLTHPPRTLDSMRGWLAQVTRNRARSIARRDMRRVQRETLAARDEADESETKMHERLALQHQVVEAVLALREPYKSVVVLAYYEGLSPTEIAKRRDIPAGTVRAQLSRALQILREKLDAECEGGRSAWSIGLAGVLARSKPIAPGAKLLMSAKMLIPSLIVGGVALSFAWRWINHPPSNVSIDQFGYELPKALASSSSTEFNAGSTSSDAATRTPIAAASSTIDAASAAQKTALPSELTEMLTEAWQIQKLLRERLLTPDRAVVESRRDLSSLSGIHFTRLWQRYALGGDVNNQVGLDGAGAYLSFATGVQGGNEPDLSLEHGRFESGFYGVGAVVRLEGIRLADVVDARSPCPPSIDPESWSALWEESKMSERSIPEAFAKRIRHVETHEISSTRDAAVLGCTYLVRSLSVGQHDLVGAFEVIAWDEKSVTIAWRVLKRWEVRPPNAPATVDRVPVVAPPPASLRALSTDELIARREALSARATKMILDVPESLDPAFAKYALQRDGGLARIAERSRWDSLLSIDGGGAFWSFTQRSNDYQKEAQLAFEQGRFSSGFGGADCGYVLDLGETALDQVSERARLASLDEHDQKSFEFLRDLSAVPASDDPAALEIGAQDRWRAAQELKLFGAPAAIGHSYLVRCVHRGRQDVLAAFQVLARDEGGLTIAWKILRQQSARR
jgi:RNA polymerase sigma-70 factor (ECF subfamily)